MAESAAYARRGFKGNAKATKLQSQITSADTVIGCIDLSTWVGVTTNGPACLVIDRGLATEEKIEFTGLAGNSLTGCTRGVDGTAPAGHSANAPVEHCLRARDIDEANAHIANPALDHHTQYVKGATLTTRGDIFTRGAAGVQRLALPVANRVLRSDGTDAVWGQVVTADILDANVTRAKIAAEAWVNGGGGVSQSAANTPIAATGVARYEQVGKRVTGYAYLLLSAGGTAGQRIRAQMPVAARADTGGIVAGAYLIYDNSAATWMKGSVEVFDATNGQFSFDGDLGALPAFTLGVNDTVAWSFTYEAA